MNLKIGINPNNNSLIQIPESGLYQNFLITGTIGTGKTSSAMYPFTSQFIEFNFLNPQNKIPMLILDVKGNYYKYVKETIKKYNLLDDLIVIELKSNIFYNPLHKPNLKAQILANRLKTVLTLFSENNSESYWLDKAEQILTECIKLCRLYNDNYVTFLEIHKLITIENYYKEKIEYLRNLFISNKLTYEQIYELNTSLDFFQKEFHALDQRTKSILVSEITRITGTFISDFDVTRTFCPPKEKLNFLGFSNSFKKGKIVVLNMNISEYSLLSKIIATYLKLDFQSEIIGSLSKDKIKTSVFICDEYDKYCTKTDSEFFSMSREAKCINIVSTQSYSSLKNTLKDESEVKVLIQNLINKIWFRTDDTFTMEEAQKLLGKEEKERTSRTISENAKETNYSYLTNTLNSINSNISESYNTYSQNDFIFDTNYFSRELETFTALTFLSDGYKILPPTKLNFIPYFKKG
ncbi:MAG: type IV secretion system DNA-binding domain-containing protein [Clostridia bacterium]|nr:type IV secretion system DNA-binding domain-containing protein [Clostridia bacterium]